MLLVRLFIHRNLRANKGSASHPALEILLKKLSIFSKRLKSSF